MDWRKKVGDTAFKSRYASMPVDSSRRYDITVQLR